MSRSTKFGWCFDIIGNGDTEFRDFHWFAITTVVSKYPYPIWEIRVWIANYDLRLMWWTQRRNND